MTDDFERQPLQDIQAEQSTLGAMLLSESACSEVLDILTAHDFYKPAHGTIFTAVEKLYTAGDPVDAVTVSAELMKHGDLNRIGGGAALHSLINSVPTAANGGYYAERVKEQATLRRLVEAGTRIVQMGYSTDGSDVEQILAKADEELEAVHLTASAGPEKGIMVPSLADFLAADEDPFDWVVPGLLERGDRVIVTGPEGGGKSTLLRQLAVQLSAGIHPFDGPSYPPLRVLLLDLENSARQTRRALRPLVERAGGTDLPLFPEIRPQGLDVLRAEDAAHLESIVSAVRPDVVIGGPVYKMAGGNPTEELPAKAVSMLLDRLRTVHGFALVLESHTPYANGGSIRPLRPYGASLWSRWPEFGIHLSAEGQLTHWRGQRDERAWPVQLQRGETWPWIAISRGRDLLWLEIVRHCQKAGKRLSYRALETATGSAKTTIIRTVGEHPTEWEALAKEPTG